MSMKFVNRICPNCNNPNYMVLLDDSFSVSFKYKCVNCHSFFNNIDFEKEPLQPVWKSECMNTKVDMVEVVRCKYCMHYDEETGRCTLLHAHGCAETWFCADGVRK